MSDFIYSKRLIKKGILTEPIQSIYEEADKPEVNEYHGDWGSLAVSHNLYNGFSAYEDDACIAIVCGGPLLTYRDNSFITKKNSSKGTESILHRWKDGKMNWDEDLSGPFAILIIEKEFKEITFITDLMSFIPIYKFHEKDDFIISTHVDALAKVSNQSEHIDPASQVDFILHGVITYPYTMYEKIKQVKPATIHQFNNKSNTHSEKNYWLPYEKEIGLSIDDAGIKLRNSLKDYIQRIVKETNNISQFISGGEDSRVLSALLQKVNRDGFIFIDEMNLEGKIAKRVAEIYGADLQVHTRHKHHYSHILPSCSTLVGSGSQYHHAHTFGFHQSCELQSYDAVFGGLFSDALLKGARIKKVHRSGQLPLKPEAKSMDYSPDDVLLSEIFKNETLKEVTNRRKTHLKKVQSFRTKSAEEWFELWPSSMNMNIPNIHANRRLFRSYEPFMSNEVVKISASVPQEWKLNRKLFHKMAKPLLRPSKWLRHGDGWFPYFSWRLKSITIPFVLLKRKIEREFVKSKKVHGPWGNWSVVTTSDDWYNMIEKHQNGTELLLPTLESKDFKDVIYNDELNLMQHINLVQTLYLNSKINS